MNDTEGLIVKATGGFYYVDAAGVLYECRARGVFRKQGVSPLVGDRVTVEPRKQGSCREDYAAQERPCAPAVGQRGYVRGRCLGGRSRAEHAGHR